MDVAKLVIVDEGLAGPQSAVFTDEQRLRVGCGHPAFFVSNKIRAEAAVDQFMKNGGRRPLVELAVREKVHNLRARSRPQRLIEGQHGLVVRIEQIGWPHDSRMPRRPAQRISILDNRDIEESGDAVLKADHTPA
jgi:hypothetical protein